MYISKGNNKENLIKIKNFVFQYKFAIISLILMRLTFESTALRERPVASHPEGLKGYACHDT